MKIKNLVRGGRLWLAHLIAPAGADVHDPDETTCPWSKRLLEAVFWRELESGSYLDVIDELADLATRNLINFDGDGAPYVTEAGDRELARLWGSGRVPPWSDSFHTCSVHGMYEAPPGAIAGCPECSQSCSRAGVDTNHICATW